MTRRGEKTIGCAASAIGSVARDNTSRNRDEHLWACRDGGGNSRTP